MTLVQTDAGPVQGEAMAGYNAWRGIPFAAAPVGALRFRPPQLMEPWTGVRMATRWGPRAPQALDGVPDLAASFPGGQPGVSEDCLYLNVTAPTGATGLPVLVWVHGGGFVNGSGPQHVGDLEAFARDGVVCVSFNYRLGVLGWSNLVRPGYEESGVAGFLDQAAALEWVQRNIAAFGGDPARVTVAGVSAGAKSVAALMAMPAASGLFTQAISQSGGGDHVAPPAVTAAVTARLLRYVADPLTAPAEELVEKAGTVLGGNGRNTWLWRPTVDGRALPRVPVEAVAAGSANGIRLLAGHNVHEAALFAVVDPRIGDHSLRVLTEALGAERAEALRASYASRRTNHDAADLDLVSDERYGVPTLRLADGQASHGPVHRYLFDRVRPGWPAQLAGGHGMEVPFVFGQVPQQQDMHDAWVAFIRAGEPGWAPYTPERRSTMVYAATAEVVDDPHREDRLAWGDAVWASSTWFPLPD